MIQYTLWISDKEIYDDPDIPIFFEIDDDQKIYLESSHDTPPRDYYLRNFKKYRDSNPLLAFDYLLEGVSSGILTKTKIDHSKYLLQVIFNIASNQSSVPLPSWDEVLRLNYWSSKTAQRTVAKLLLRVISSDCIDLIREENKFARLVGFLMETVPDIGKSLKVNPNDQSFEQVQSWHDYGDDVNTLRSQIDLANVDSIKQNSNILKRMFSLLERNYSDLIIFEGIGNFVDGILDTIENYRNNIKDGALPDADLDRKRIEEMLKKSLEKDSLYIRLFILPILKSILSDFEKNKSIYNLPSTLSVQPVRRKYPFFDKDAEIVLKVYINNDGGGYSYDISLVIEFNDHIISKETGTNTYLHHIPKLSSGTISIDIPISLTRTTTDDLEALIDLDYRTLEEKKNDQSLIDFECETRKVDWDKFLRTQHYSIKPVTNDDEFAGKASRIDPIVADVSTNRGSSWLYGFKRTGKTSTALAVERNIRTLDDFITANCSTGDFAHFETTVMIDQMVKTITTKLCKNANIRYIKPDLNGSVTPLVDIIDEIHTSTQKNIFFVIDEFDEIPYDLYKASPLSQSFWQPLRAISLKAYASFLLVGGENIQNLKGTWGSKLNLLKTYKSHKFSTTEWEEYKQLVTIPVMESLEFSEEALQLLSVETDGNPFFTKLLCRSIGDHAGRIRNSFVGSAEVENAIIRAIEDGLEMDYFQHIIDDGLIGRAESLVTRKDQRIQFLIALIKCHRENLIPTIENHSNTAQGIGLSLHSFELLLTEFQERQLLKVNDGVISLCMPLFEKYLISAGQIELGKLLSEDHEIQRIENELIKYKVGHTEIESLLAKWGPYKARTISVLNIQTWLDQFADAEERRKAFEFLKMIRFIELEDILEKLKEAYKYATKDVTFKMLSKKSKRDDLYVTYLDGPGKSSALLSAHFIEVNQILKKNIIEYSKLHTIAKSPSKEYEKMNILVIVDDFIGSGRTMRDLIRNNRDDLKNISEKYESKIVVYVAYGMEKGRDSVLKLINGSDYDFIELFVGEIFDESEKIFSDTSRYYSNEDERERMKSILIDHYGTMVDFRRPSGFENSQVGIVFPSNCPNNSLPILWKDVKKKNKKWVALFPRSIAK